MFWKVHHFMEWLKTLETVEYTFSFQIMTWKRLIIYLRRKGAKGRLLMLMLSTCWKCRECWEKRNTSSHKKLNSLVPTCYNNVTFPAYLRGNITRVGVGACQCQLCKWYQCWEWAEVITTYLTRVWVSSVLTEFWLIGNWEKFSHLGQRWTI